MDMEKIKFLVGHTVNKAISNVDDGVDFILSNESTDRTGDIIKIDSWQLADFKNNPIALYQHDNSSPIGTWDNIRTVGKQLIGTLKMAMAGTSAEIDTIRSLLEQKIIKAVSVGFIPLEYIQVKDTYSYIYTKVSLLEASLVSVPANQNALVIARSFGADEKRIFSNPASVQLHTRAQKVALARARMALE
jgi:HK97 family phage prohead protease